MKKVILSMLVLLAMSFLLTSFDSANTVTENKLVGKWVLVTSVEYDVSSVKQSEEGGNGVVWEFSDKQLIIHDNNDELDGVPLTYSYNDGVISVDKIFITYKVYEIGENKLVIRSAPLGGVYVVLTFKRK